MSKKGEFRQFHLGFWTAANVEALDPIEKLLYIYMITSPRSNMEGVYKTTLRRIAFETGIDRDMIPKISERFELAGVGGIYHSEKDTWVVVSHAPEFLTSSPSIQGYFAENISKVPSHVLLFMEQVGYRWPEWAEKPPIKTPYTQGGYTVPPPSPQGPPTVPTPWGDTVSDTDTKTDTKTDTHTRSAPSPDAGASTGENSLPAVVEEEAGEVEVSPDLGLYHWIKDRFESAQPHHRFTDYKKEGPAIYGIIAKSRAREPDNVWKFAEGMVETFAELRRRDRKFFGGQPFLPSSLNATGIWDRVLSQAYERWQQAERIKAGSFEDVPW